MPEISPLVLSYSHLKDLPRAKDALHTLKKIASLVKPLMRARGWKVNQLAEFYPSQQNLLGLNENRGQKICLRLRYPGDQNQFLPIEHVVDTMLHELSHNVHGPHNAEFHALWDQLRDEHEALTMKGYTGEGFLSDGRVLGGRGLVPMHEARRLARQAAEKRRTLATGSSQRLGGQAPRPGQDIRRIIANAAERRNRTMRGCANVTHNAEEIKVIADTATRNGFSTQAEEDAANEAAIAQALWELVQEDDKARKGDLYQPVTIANPAGSQANTDLRGDALLGTNAKLRAAAPKRPTSRSMQSLQGQTKIGDQMAETIEDDSYLADGDSTPSSWACQVCTLQNPLDFLCCDACGSERAPRVTEAATYQRPAKRQQPAIVDLTKSDPTASSHKTTSSAGISKPNASGMSQNSNPMVGSKTSTKTWTCSFCGRVREWTYWSCDLCGKIKESS
ncbi:hypothetical protein PFICI_06227 [Pestalotiopsis fici W106-1]|uniref:WLM domain-containing protein n=1 Tax=Pestalotiopsis fici (strain W106-1 / CGMCC3.15140) TaxID=1229662 RepID=W3X5B0_PESFW|nr:uncharacterized protein PFICI_06227 [Pestalotiopsis fici W106-1]ETS81225.1 hypothetical protein PFICI_06227 [Pestalotiopsis fici W106-1]